MNNDRSHNLEMNKMKLAVIDKDGTLTTPISGAMFPQNPQDQQLMPGAREALDRLRADGWALTIASNQGACDWHEVSADSLVVGSRFRLDKVPGNLFFQEDFTLTLIAPGSTTDKNLLIKALDHTDDGREAEMTLDINETVLVQYKTIESAIEECQFAADLCGIDVAMFAPDMAGQKCIDMMKTRDSVYGHPKTTDRIWKVGETTCDGILIENYRKPGAGMLTWASISTHLGDWTDRIMIGDRPEDEAAARAAGFRFLDAKDWRVGADA